MAAHGTALAHGEWAGWLPPDVGAPWVREHLGPYDWKRAGLLRNPVARGRFVATRLLIRHAAGAVLGVAPDEVDLAYRLEPLDRHLAYESVRRLLCTPAEQEWLGRLTDSECARELLRLWTLKEACTKAIGQGMRMGFTGFGFTPDGAGLVSADGSPHSADTTVHCMLDADLVDEVLLVLEEQAG
ncbi:4'-phosphopantetheinyl transferase family protein [Streptomyces sp. NPDC003032]